MDVDVFLEHYIAAALWSSVNIDQDGNEVGMLDDDYGPEDIAPETLAQMRADCEDFIASNARLLARAERWFGRDEEACGHDFWLTRNGHGVGFWDRGMGKLGDKLSDAAYAYGGVDLYVGDDGLIYG